jgi:hypothetical protein
MKVNVAYDHHGRWLLPKSDQALGTNLSRGLG